MSAKAEKLADSFRYQSEDLEHPDPAAAEASLDSYLQRNKDAINASIDQDHAEFERGEYFTLEQVMADIDSQRQRSRGIEDLSKKELDEMMAIRMSPEHDHLNSLLKIK